MIDSPFLLPCGVAINNRVVKAATTERLAGPEGKPNAALIHLYDHWARSNAGLLITGNVMIDPTHLESAGNVVVKDDNVLEEMKQWAEAGKKKGNDVWTQINHSGRQTSKLVNTKPKSASDVQLKKMALFAKPKAMSEYDIEEVIQGFVRAAEISKRAGFTGIQVHSAHGYLLSQFLSPLTNKRKDNWGGSIENRSRLLRLIVKKIREVVGPEYPISVKLNSADFQRGGFTEEESLQVVSMLDSESVDLLEISGGTYENLVFFTRNEKEEKKKKTSTIKREAYFLDFAKKVREVSKIPLMVTGGFRTFSFAEEVLKNGEVDFIGMARPFILNSNEIASFIKGEVESLADLEIRTGIADMEDSAEGGFYARNIIRLAHGKEVKFNYSAIGNAVFLIRHEFVKSMVRKFSKKKS